LSIAQLGNTPARTRNDRLPCFTLNRLIDAAANGGIVLRMGAARPQGHGPVTGTR
jgi:hypothetical protein